VTETIRRAKAAGFREWKPGETLAAGGRYYVNNRGRSMALFVVGRTSVDEGVRISASHIDSPRLDLKARPVYEAEGFALFQTSPHGGILNYQWGNTPLALVGRVFRKDGTAVDVSVGLEPGDPVFMVAGLSPHVDIDLRERRNRDVLASEELDPIVGSMPKSATEGVRAQLADHLRQTYGFGLEDLVSAELSLVPAMAPRDVGFDRAMMAMSGQDDRFAAFASLDALFDVRNPERTAIVYLADNEESGNNNNTGAGSDFLVDLMAQMAAAQRRGGTPDMARGRAATRVLSTDVNDAVNPQWPGAWEGGNAPRSGQGINIKVYGPCWTMPVCAGKPRPTRSAAPAGALWAANSPAGTWT
jgi:aspartyl aminopeptidase